MKKDATVEAVVTGIGWMGGGISSIDTTLRELVTTTTRELQIVTYSISDGADSFLNALEDRLRNGVRILFVVERLAAQHGSVPLRLHRFALKYQEQFRLFDFTAENQAALHAKCIISDRQRALIGSANLSFNGLVKNHELAVLIEGDAVEDLARTVERLPGSASVRQIIPSPSDV